MDPSCVRLYGPANVESCPVSDPLDEAIVSVAGVVVVDPAAVVKTA